MQNREDKNKLIKNDILRLSDGLQPIEKTSDDILQELSNSISEIDFQILAFPDINEVKKLQNSWFKIGTVPRSQNLIIWNNFQHHIK